MTLRRIFLLPAQVWMAVFFAVPLVIVCLYSVLTRGDYGGVEAPLAMESYTRLADSVYLGTFWRSFWIASVSTAACAVFGFPLALFIARSGKWKGLYLQLVLLPFWTSSLIRTYAWIFLLRDTGLFNSVLLSLHFIRRPLPLLYNDGAVLLGMVYNFLPFFVLPMYAALERLDPALLEAASDLGATPWRALWLVTIPVSKAGIVAGSALVFIPCLGSYLIPDLLGGGKTVMVGNLIQNQFTSARDWPFGSAASLLLMLLSAIVLVGLMRSRSVRDVL